jgi:thermitase
VAILDCGIFSQGTGRKASDGQAGHRDLRGKVVLERDFTGSSTGFDDYCDHGTHVAGTVSALTNNGLGVAGVGYNVSLMNGKVLDDNGDGWTTDTAQGIIWAADNGAKVINMSLGRYGSCSFTETFAINYAWERGVVVVASAGNDDKNKSGAPASCPNVISVAATDDDDDRAWFSNYGANVDVAAPGVSILSTRRNGGYTSFNGTSMAAPHVAGLAALIWSADPNPSAQRRPRRPWRSLRVLPASRRPARQCRS